MNLKSSLWQFVKDGFIGLGGVLIVFGILTLIPEFRKFYGGSEDYFLGFMFFFQESVISPMPSVMLVGFISMGIGGKLLENVTSRWTILKPTLVVVISAWIIGIVSFELSIIDYWKYDWVAIWTPVMLIITIAGAGVGFITAGLAGVTFNPSKRLYRLFIGTIASTIVGYAVGLTIIFIQLNW